ncbi:MAG TPA: GspE/PulE family protein [Thermoanaerobaculia bacterium]|nr:GspE/PulE family protein [Thermoanaerobaculia bacterium]
MNDEQFFEKIDRTLLSYRLITDREREEVALLRRERGMSYEHALHQASGLDMGAYKRILEEVSGRTAFDPSQIAVDPDFIQSILEVLPLSVIVSLKVFPIALRSNQLTLAMPNPSDQALITELQSTTSLQIAPVVTTYRGVQQAIEENYGAMLRDVLRQIREGDGDNILEIVHEAKRAEGLDVLYEKFLALVNREYERLREDPEELGHFVVHPVVVSFVQRLMMDLILRNCSDIHLEPAAEIYRVRSRINGVLSTVHELPRKCGEVVSMRLKLMAGLELLESPVPLDAQINYSPVYGRRVEFRVSVLPTIHGNKTVMRLLEKENQAVGLERIGLTPSELDVVRRNIGAPNGLILVTGPTGSGKTSTLYSLLSLLNDDERCIVTAEEPVESEVPGVVQVACGKQMSFAMALRSFLRQDPDVIMVGEIRDQETADIAVKAALTGHLVLSTLHTNDAPTAVMRLLNLDLDPFVVASSVRMVLAQRLMRVLCPECKRRVSRDDLIARHGTADVPESDSLYDRGEGCAVCNGTGYKGRTGVFEILEGGDAMADAINRRAPLGEIRAIARDNGMLSLRERALAVFMEGRSTFDEVLRVTAE